MGKSRVLLVRLDRGDLIRASGGVVVKVVVTHANIGVSVEDDEGCVVHYRRAELRGSGGDDVGLSCTKMGVGS